MPGIDIPKGGCTIRCYRHGLGDCFLLAFDTGEQKPKFMLIDCGVLTGTPDAKAVMKKVANDIRKVTGSKLDILAVTHEHWDHISGFYQAREVFEKVEVDELWLAWTEDPRDDLAAELGSTKNKAFVALTEMVDNRNAEFLGTTRQEQIKGLLGFYGDPALAASGGSTVATMQWIKDRWAKKKYCRPGGKPLQLEGLPEVRFFVMGPPADPAYIRKSRPKKGTDQVYLTVPSLEAAMTRLNLAADAAQRPRSKVGNPFAAAYEVHQQAGGNYIDGFERHQQPTDALTSAITRYADPAEKWRQIGNNYAELAGELALRLDEHTNNTSLVFAIELSPGGKVLLFPADAQVGSWLSWHDIKWSKLEGDRIITTEDLLARTCFYKVGHHASHNATLNAQGLELMTSPHLQAFIPVSKEMAQRRHWKMPYGPLAKRLEERTNGRTFVADEKLEDSQQSGQLTQTDLYLDIRIAP